MRRRGAADDIRAMADGVLIAYATKHVSTKEVARAIAEHTRRWLLPPRI